MQGGLNAKTQFIYSISYFNLGGLGALFGGTKPTKVPPLWRRDCSEPPRPSTLFAQTNTVLDPDHGALSLTQFDMQQCQF